MTQLNCVSSPVNPEAYLFFGYEQTAKAMRLFTAPETKRDALFQIFKMIALSVVIRNGDAHLKNFGILYDTPEIRNVKMAPAFDFVTTTPYLPADTMALTLGGTKRWPARKQLESFGRVSCGLSAAEIKTCLADVEQGVAETLEDVWTWAKEEPAFKEVGNAMSAAWENGLAEVFPGSVKVFDTVTGSDDD